MSKPNDKRAKAASQPTPRELGYRMPAEWEPHHSTWLGWPQNRQDWPGKFEPIPWVYAEMVRHLARVEHVDMILRDEATRGRARRILQDAGADLAHVKFHLWPTDRGWTRDSGPIFLVRKSKGEPLATANWRFNAWAKYSNWRHDRLLPQRIGQKLKLPKFVPMVQHNGRPYHVVLEGGSIDVNGRGLMLTTEECLLSRVQQRNPGLKKSELERIFSDYLGVEKVIWLDRGIAGDDTHGHVDDISRFVAPDTILTAVERNRGDSNYAPLQENLRRLRNATDLDGRRFKVIALPLPRPVIFQGQRLPASYANFYIANGLVLVPTFNDPNDRIALNTIAEVLPRHEVVGIHCGDFIWGLGAIHCATQQQPAVRS
ncbi:MAG TPA: agmatine deiminase family protein [Candidatus Limnocylindrales bacterium]|nr:agmatine deiminase family protein [Candidatus Limnocylindrales bacterium]